MNPIHWWYWILRTLHLRPKAKPTITWDKDGKGFSIKIDKLDPGESVNIGLLLEQGINKKAPVRRDSKKTRSTGKKGKKKL